MPQWNAGGVKLPHGPYMIGAGVCKTPATTEEWLKVAPVVSGSYTPQQRDGNPGKVVWPDSLEEMLRIGYGLNSYGMPNAGFAAAATSFLQSQKTEQPLIVSVAGFSVDDYVLGVRTFGVVSNVTAIELNFGCPNTQGEHNTIVSFDPDTVWQIMLGIGRLELQKPIWVKLSPYSNPQDLQRMAEILNHCVGPQPLAVVTCNTFPNAFAGEGLIDPNSGMAGLSGPVMKPIALGQVKQFRTHLDEQIDIIGVGGVTTGDDVVDLLEAGAQAVQITSLAHWAGDPRRFHQHLLIGERSSRLVEYLTNDA